MKKYILAGFSLYAILNNRTVIENESGEVVTPTKVDKKAGKITLTASEDDVENGIVKGNAYTYKMDDLMELGDSQNLWIDAEQTAPAQTESAAPKETDAAKEKRKAEKKALKEKLEKARTALFTAKPEDAQTALTAFQAVQKEYDDFIGTTPAREFTDEEKAVIADYESRLEIFNTLSEERKAVKEAMDAIELPSGYKKGKTGAGDDVPQRASGKLTYETAQQIRKEASVGRFDGQPEDKQESFATIAERHGTSAQMVNYIVNYIAHKLRKGDKAYTPLVNDYYPALGAEFNCTGTDGAPYVEDKVKENWFKYVKAATRKEPSVTVDGTDDAESEA